MFINNTIILFNSDLPDKQHKIFTVDNIESFYNNIDKKKILFIQHIKMVNLSKVSINNINILLKSMTDCE